MAATRAIDRAHDGSIVISTFRNELDDLLLERDQRRTDGLPCALANPELLLEIAVIAIVPEE